METAIKQYKQLTCIELKSGRVLFTPATMEEVSKILSDKSKDYVVVDWVWFNRMTEVKEYYPYTPTDFDLFILSHPKDVQKRLRDILKDRESKGFETKSTEHLRNIYQSKFTQ